MALNPAHPGEPWTGSSRSHVTNFVGYVIGGSQPVCLLIGIDVVGDVRRRGSRCSAPPTDWAPRPGVYTSRAFGGRPRRRRRGGSRCAHGRSHVSPERRPPTSAMPRRSDRPSLRSRPLARRHGHFVGHAVLPLADLFFAWARAASSPMPLVPCPDLVLDTIAIHRPVA